MYYYFNPDYHLKYNKDNFLLLTYSLFFSPKYNGETKFESKIPQLFAVLLSYFDGQNLDSIYDKIEKDCKIQREKVEPLLSQLINNDERVFLKIEKEGYVFPKNCIIKRNKPIIEYKEYSHIRENKYNIDFPVIDINRHYTPTDIILNLTTKCYTDCIYCYCDRSRKFDSPLSLDKINSLTDEFENIGVRNFDITGGDIFMYSKWKEVIKYVISRGFKPYLSTKKPLNETEVEILKNIGVDSIQFSLDSLFPKQSTEVVRIGDGYIDKVRKTFNCLKKYGIEVNLHTIITNKNKEKESILKLSEFVREFDNIYEWRIDNAFYSSFLTLGQNKLMLPRLHDMEKIGEWLKEIEQTMRKDVKLTYLEAGDFKTEPYQTIEEFHDRRSGCSANWSALYVLPDGKVTICEFLYWHERFIIGDINKNTILEIWNSEKAKNLFHLKREMVRDSSPCKHCDGFEICHNYKHFCWKDVIAAYGNENWDFPDPSCPKAPKHDKHLKLL